MLRGNIRWPCREPEHFPNHHKTMRESRWDREHALVFTASPLTIGQVGELRRKSTATSKISPDTARTSLPWRRSDRASPKLKHYLALFRKIDPIVFIKTEDLRISSRAVLFLNQATASSTTFLLELCSSAQAGLLSS